MHHVKPRRLSILLTAAAAGVCALALLFPQMRAQAQRVRVQVFLTQAQIPRGLSERGLLGFARGHRAGRLQESSEAELNQRHFRANVVFAFSRPPGDLEFHALFYDIHEGAREFVTEMSVFVSDRSQRTVLHRIDLPRPRFRPNRRMELVVTLRREEIGSVRFETVGEEIRHSGRVDFSDEETRQRD
jgi:hypothetical protein